LFAEFLMGEPACSPFIQLENKTGFHVKVFACKNFYVKSYFVIIPYILIVNNNCSILQTFRKMFGAKPQSGEITKMMNIEAVELAGEQIWQTRNQINYTTLGLTVGYTVQMLRDGDIYLPENQHHVAWTDQKRMRLIETVLLGLPFSELFAIKIEEEKWELLDGVQRLTTLDAFLNNDIQLKNLERLSKCNGFRFSDLSPLEQGKFESRNTRIVLLLENVRLETRRDLFTRINGLPEPASQPVKNNNLLGLFADDAEIIDYVTESAMQARENNPLRCHDG